MTCSDFIRNFSDYIDGKGDAGLCGTAERHLDGCVDCRRYVEVFERGRGLLRGFPELEVSDDFRPRLRHRIYHIEDRAAIEASSGSAATAATALAMAVLVVLAAWSPMMTGSPSVDLAPIVVTAPAPRPAGLRPAALLGMPSSFGSAASSVWDGRGRLLFQYSPLARGAGLTRVRPGLD
jgi:anti-sigma factor RsiW